MKASQNHYQSRWIITLCALIWALSGRAIAEPAPSGTRLVNITAAGSGCPQGSYYGVLNESLGRLTLYFNEFIAEVGQNVPVASQRKTCQLNIHLTLPGGWAYALESYNVRGYALLAAGQSAQHTAEMWFQGVGTPNRLARAILYGPADRDFQLAERLPAQSLMWSSCENHRALNARLSFNIQQSRTGQPRHGIIAVDSAQGSAAFEYGLRFKRCY